MTGCKTNQEKRRERARERERERKIKEEKEKDRKRGWEKERVSKRGTREGDQREEGQKNYFCKMFILLQLFFHSSVIEWHVYIALWLLWQEHTNCGHLDHPGYGKRWTQHLGGNSKFD